jgi:aryl-alcohol dehydrogenase-like predicted oxidoreductase
MKSLAVAERYNLPRHVAHQAYYSLANREYESELMPLGLDQGVSAIVWSPLASGRLTGKIRRGLSVPEGSRRGLRPEDGPFVEDGHLFTIIDAIDETARETRKSVTQIALNWLLQRPTVASLIIGARNETQLSENFGAIGWALTPDQVQRLDKASRVIPTYPYWHQEGFAERNPFPAQ